MRLILLVFVIASTCGLRAQTSEFYRTFDISEGMQTSTVYNLFTDSKGFIYMGTELGLTKFNGVEFTHFPQQNNRGLAVHNITEDASGTIWCMNFANQILYLDQDTLRVEEHLSEAIEGNLRDFIVADSGLWVISDERLHIYRDQTLTLVKTDTLRVGYFQSIHYCPELEHIITVDDLSICFFKHNGQLEKRIVHELRQVEFTCDSSGYYYSDKSNPQSIITSEETILLTEDAETNYVNRIKKKAQSIHLCTNRGLYVIDTAGGGLTARMFENVRITDMTVDHEEGVWYSTIGRGVFYLPSPGISRLTSITRPPTALAKGQNGHIYIGSNKGEIIETDTDGNMLWQQSTNYATEIEFIYFDIAHNRLLTSHGIFDPDLKTYTPERLGKSITTDDSGNFIMRSFNRVLLFNQDLISEPNTRGLVNSSQFEFYNARPSFTLHNERSISALWSRIHQAYFIGSSSGLYKITPDGKQQLFYLSKPLIATSIHETSDGRMFIGTLQHGLLQYDGTGFQPVLNKETGAASNDFLKASWASDYAVFLTPESIEYYRWKPAESYVRISSYYALARLNSTGLLALDSTIMLATSDGLLTVPIPGDQTHEDLKIFKPRLYANERLLAESESSVTFSDRQVSFEVDLIDYRSMGDVMINYRLLGHSTEWSNQHASNRWVRFISLPPGSYQFEVFASSPGRTSQVMSYAFTVHPPYWLSWWFLGSISLFTAFLIILGTWMVIRQQQRKQEQQQLLLRSQLTALRSQMNPHFLFNALNSIQGMIYSNKKTEASTTLRNFAQLMRRILEFSEKDDVTLDEELLLIESYLQIEAQRLDDNFNYEIKRDHPHEFNSYRIPTMIVQPFVENAVKHGLLHKEGQRNLEVRTSCDDKNLVISIRDNGIGRQASALKQKQRIGKSFATGAINARVELLNKVKRSSIQIDITDLYDAAGVPKGTLVNLTIPIHVR